MIHSEKNAERRRQSDDTAPLDDTPPAAHIMAQKISMELGASLREAWEEMAAEDPDVVEDDELRRAIELSLLDCALVPLPGAALVPSVPRTADPHDILGVPPGAGPDEIRAAYRRRALVTHPDKGGKAGEFERVALAYRSLLASTRSIARENSFRTPPASIRNTAHWDAELKEHQDLVREMFAGHGMDLAANVARQAAVRDGLGLRSREAGASNRNERNETIRNSCFYLSLAVSYLSGIGAFVCPTDAVRDGYWDEDKTLRDADDALISQTALQLKRTIEGAVIAAHPEWAQQGLVGEEVQAFSDFLVYTLENDTILRDWAVAVFDETSGFVDVYKGKGYGGGGCTGDGWDDWARRANTLTLRFVPGHYQPLLPVDADRPSLDEILAVLDQADIFYVVTDGAG
mmetsp:Transcript_42205/g.82816  ORF Transcript_42205/g.82816 Transcript_42205/m.82816 type:complete len:403 (-) Transcript_42205:409-1617(-)